MARTPRLPAPVKPPMSAQAMVLLLALLLGLQPVTTDLYLPALPAMAHDLHIGSGQAQTTLTALLLAFGVSQLVWGPLSDRWGRRPVLLWGLSIYTAAAAVCALAPSLTTLVAARVAQGVAMGAAVMSARAIVRDVFSPAQGAVAMSKALTGLGIMACACAPLGGWLSDVWGWRAVWLALAACGAGTLALVALRFQETLAHPDPQALRPRPWAATQAQLLRHRGFVTWCALSASSYLGLFTFLACSPFVFIGQLGYSKTTYGLFMLGNSLAYIAGTFMCRALLGRIGIRRTVALAAGLNVCGGLGLGVAAWALAGHGAPLTAGAQGHGAWAVMLPMALFMLGHGVHQPCSQTGAVAAFAHCAGAASALNGCAMMLAAFGMGLWLHGQMHQPLQALALGVCLWSACIAAVAWVGVPRLGAALQPNATANPTANARAHKP